MRGGSALSALICCLFLAVAADAAADEDHDRARDALRAGRILPLERIVDTATAQFGGDVLDVELEDADESFHYRLKLLAADGRILKLDYDAATGELLHVKGHGRHHWGRR